MREDLTELEPVFAKLFEDLVVEVVAFEDVCAAKQGLLELKKADFVGWLYF